MNILEDATQHGATPNDAEDSEQLDADIKLLDGASIPAQLRTAARELLALAFEDEDPFADALANDAAENVQACRAAIRVSREMLDALEVSLRESIDAERDYTERRRVELEAASAF
jgi:hypothetical protein